MPRYVDLNNPKIIKLGRDKFGDVMYHIPPDLPTLDLVERKKGIWIDTGSGEECSICREIQYGYDNFRHYCSNCGAEMEVNNG